MNTEINALLNETLASLKDFQTATVKAVISNFDLNGSGRVLVADEVGLGKTIIAKGVIAELLKKHLNDSSTDVIKRPFRVTYICSNLTLANENREKLAVFKGSDKTKYVLDPSYDRLLKVVVKQDAKHSNEKILELCTLTPSTSFNLSAGHGNWQERLIIYFSVIKLDALEDFENKLSIFFSDDVGNWENEKSNFYKEHSLDMEMVYAFHELLKLSPNNQVKQDLGLSVVCNSWIDILTECCSNESLESKYKTRVRTHIRSLYASACAKHLSADLFILDEFQRFKSLLNTDVGNDESLVAREIFHSGKKSKILLLSATPFKALSNSDEDETGDSHADEISFLLNFISGVNQKVTKEYELKRKDIHTQILSLRDPKFPLTDINDKSKSALEAILRPYISRNERAQMIEKYKNLFKSIEESCILEFTKLDIDAFKALDHLGQAIHILSKSKSSSQLMEFFKATPWPLSFLSGYQFKLLLDKNRKERSIKNPLKKSKPAWLSHAEIQNYQIELTKAPQAKIRALTKKVFESNSEELLWVPPSLPQYGLQGSFKTQADFTKTLLFSSWAMVPRSLSGLISYEAERRLLLKRTGVKKMYHKESAHSPKLKLDSGTSLSGWSLVYPSKTMQALNINCTGVNLDTLISERIVFFKEQLEKLNCFENDINSGDRWFALAPMLIDKFNGNEKFLKDWLNQLIRQSEGKPGQKQQLLSLAKYLNDENLKLGKIPTDLAHYLAILSIAGPSVCIARTWSRLWPSSSEIDVASSATTVGLSVLAMFNKPEAESVLGKLFKKSKTFQSIAQYCADGCFQSVIDEYGHLLKDAGLSLSNNDQTSDSATKRLSEVLEFRTSSIACQFYENKSETSDLVILKADKLSQKHTLRCHYAVPLGNQKISDEKGVQRVGAVRDAFNSPFRPFMLNSTSIGQEGLDFHWYCHRVVHWNVPSNPIDIEQREGRVNRYKSLLVRKRIAENYGNKMHFEKGDPWQKLFDFVDTKTKENGRNSDLVPYWHIPEGGAKLERFIPMMPMSRDQERFGNALKTLALYRLAFGQPRQEELLDNLLKRNFTESEIDLIKNKLMINLSPMMKCR